MSSCHPIILSSCYLVTLSYCHFVILYSCHLVIFLSCHLVILSPCHLVILSSCHLAILSSCNPVILSPCRAAARTGRGVCRHQCSYWWQGRPLPIAFCCCCKFSGCPFRVSGCVWRLLCPAAASTGPVSEKFRSLPN